MSNPQAFTRRTKINRNTSKAHFGPSKTHLTLLKKSIKNLKSLFNVLELGQNIN
jgi:hypothetical protein